MDDFDDEWTEFDEQQARTDALSLAVTVSKVGTHQDTIIKRAQKFYGFIMKCKANVVQLDDKKRHVKKD